MNQELIRQARVADLSQFLLERHACDIKISGLSICLRDRPYVCTKMGYCGYVDYHSDETGNSIDFLVKYLGYTFQNAVLELLKTCSPSAGENGHVSGDKRSSPLIQQKTFQANLFTIPEPTSGPYTRVVNYLHSRAIPDEMVQRLIHEGLLYQDAAHANAVFLSRAKDFCEIRGTMDIICGKAFHGIRRLHPNCFWSCRNASTPVEVAYICESSIDAISLCVLCARAGMETSAAYVGIGGVANQQTIDRISHSVRTILAVDHDEAGDKCRRRNASLETIIPCNKDWNEDLMAGTTSIHP